MKGNDKDCICAKNNDKHTKRCDAYRLAEFYIKAASVVCVSCPECGQEATVSVNGVDARLAKKLLNPSPPPRADY